MGARQVSAITLGHAGSICPVVLESAAANAAAQAEYSVGARDGPVHPGIVMCLSANCATWCTGRFRTSASGTEKAVSGQQISDSRSIDFRWFWLAGSDFTTAVKGFSMAFE